MPGAHDRLKMPNPYGLTEWEYEEINRMAEEASMKRMDSLFDSHPDVVEQRKRSQEFVEEFKHDQDRNQSEYLLNAAMDHIAGTLEQPIDSRAWDHLLIYCPLEILEVAYVKKSQR